MSPKYPHIKVELSGSDGNAYAILGAVRRAMVRSDLSSEEIQRFMDEARSGDYDHLIQVAMHWVNVS